MHAITHTLARSCHAVEQSDAGPAIWYHRTTRAHQMVIKLQVASEHYQYQGMKLPAISVHHLFLRVDEAAILGAQPHIADRHSIIFDEVGDPGVLYLHPVVEHSNTAL